jgi:hypothetical protein
MKKRKIRNFNDDNVDEGVFAIDESTNLSNNNTPPLIN